MFIQPILPFSAKNNSNVFIKRKKSYLAENQTPKNSDEQVLVPNNVSNITFGALAVRKALEAESKLYTKFIKSKEKSVLKFLEKENAAPSSVFKFLVHSTGKWETMVNTAKELCSNPRNGESIKKFLISKLGGDKTAQDLFNIWYHDENSGYRSAYSAYYHFEIWLKAKKMNDIVKQSPNLHPLAFQNKAQELGIEPTLGEVPKDFGSIDTFRSIVDRLKIMYSEKSGEIQNVARNTHKQTNCLLESMNIVNKKRSELFKPFELEIDKKVFEINPIVKSFSAKIICIINEKGSKDKYVLKYSPFELQEANVMCEDFARELRPDMPYLQAITDFYLKLNSCKNAPEIEFFDYKSQAVLYKKTEGTAAEIPEKYSDNIYQFSKFNKIADVKNLGLYLNDIHGGNFVVNEKGEYILIDSGHSTYNNIFRPLIVAKQITLGNLCGRELCK